MSVLVISTLATLGACLSLPVLKGTQTPTAASEPFVHDGQGPTLQLDIHLDAQVKGTSRATDGKITCRRPLTVRDTLPDTRLLAAKGGWGLMSPPGVWGDNAMSHRVGQPCPEKTTTLQWPASPSTNLLSCTKQKIKQCFAV